MKKIFLAFLCLFMATSIQLIEAQPCFEDPPGSGNFRAPDGSNCVNTIVSAVPFLRIVPDARSGAMGDVGIALSPDANAMHFNASKLAFVEDKVGVSATYTPWLRALGLNDVYMAYLSSYYSIDDLQTLGLSLRYFSLGSIAFTDDNGQPLGEGRPNEFEIAGAYTRKLGENFSAGLTAKFIFSNLAAGQTIGSVNITPGTAGAADVSFTYRTPFKISEEESDLFIGLAISNIGTKITYTESINRDFIPANLGLGGAANFRIDRFNTITVAGDINKLLVPTPCLGDNCDEDNNQIADYKEQSMFNGVLSSFTDAPNGLSEELNELMYSIGVEYWYDQQFAVRAGYYSEHRTKGNRKFFTVGLGLRYSIFGINFSYLVPTTNQRNPLDNTLRFSLLFHFGEGDTLE